MSKTITIPDVGMNPLVVTVGVDTYTYNVGDTVIVPDAVAAVIAGIAGPVGLHPGAGASVVIAETGGKPHASVEQIRSAAARGSAVLCVLDGKRVLHLKNITSSSAVFQGAGYSVTINASGQTVESDPDVEDVIEAATEAAEAAEAAAAAALDASGAVEYKRSLPPALYANGSVTTTGAATSSTKAIRVLCVPGTAARIFLTEGYDARVVFYNAQPSQASEVAGACISATSITKTTMVSDIAPAGTVCFSVAFFHRVGGETVAFSVSDAPWDNLGIYLTGGYMPASNIAWGKLYDGSSNSYAATWSINAAEMVLVCSPSRCRVAWYDGTTHISHDEDVTEQARLLIPPEGATVCKIQCLAAENSIAAAQECNHVRIVYGVSLYDKGSTVWQEVKAANGSTADAVSAAQSAMESAVDAMQDEVDAAVATVNNKVDSRYLAYEDPVTLWWEIGGISQTSATASGGAASTTKKMRTYISGAPGDGQTTHHRFIDNVDVVLDVDLSKCKVLDVFFYNDDVTPGDAEYKTDHSCYMQSMIYKKNGQGLDNPTYPETMSRIYVKDYAPAGATKIRIVVALPDDTDISTADEREIITGITARGVGLVCDTPRSEGVRNLQRRARLIESIPYTTTATLPGQTGDKPSNTEVRGVMYSSARLNLGYVPDYVSLETYMSMIHYSGSDIYTKTQTNYNGDAGVNGKTWIGCVCSSLARFCLDILPPYVTENWLQIPGMRLAPTQSFEDVEIGDTVCSNGSGHVVVITDVWRDKYGKVKQIETIEAVTPSCKRLVRTPAQMEQYFFVTEASLHYMICRYDYIDKVTYREDPFWSVPGDKEFREYEYNDDIAANIGDACVVNTEDTVAYSDDAEVVQLTDGWAYIKTSVDGVVSSDDAPGKGNTYTVDLSTPGMYEVWLETSGGDQSKHLRFLSVSISAPAYANGKLTFEGVSSAPLANPFAVLLQDQSTLGFTGVYALNGIEAAEGAVRVDNMPAAINPSTGDGGLYRVLYQTAYGVVASAPYEV